MHRRKKRAELVAEDRDKLGQIPVFALFIEGVFSRKSVKDYE